MLGEILISDGILSQEQLEKALHRQIQSGGRLGTNLVELMYVDEVALGEALARQMSVPAVHPMVLERISDDVLKLLPRNNVEYNKMIPFKLEGKRLHVAMLTPTDIELVDDLSHRTGFIIKPYVVAETVLLKMLLKHYDIPPPLRTSQIRDGFSHVPQDELTITTSDIVHDTSGIISLDDEGHFTLVDRADILGDKTKELFLDSMNKREVVGYFLQFLGYVCDRVAFLAYDRNKNFLWRDAKEFQNGREGIACGVQVTRSPFWNKYLEKPGFYYTRLPVDGNGMEWVNPMLDMDLVKGLFLAPVNISPKIVGVAIGGSAASLRLEEELETIKKLHVMAISAIKIQEFKKIIQKI